MPNGERRANLGSLVLRKANGARFSAPLCSPRANLWSAAEPPRLPLRRELAFAAALRRQKTEGERTRGCCLLRGVDEHRVKNRSFAFSLAYIKCFRTYSVYLSFRLPAQILYAGIHLPPQREARALPRRATFPKGKAKRLPPQTAELASESIGKPKYSLRKTSVSPVRLCAPHKSFPCVHFSFLIAPKAKIAIYRYRNRKKI